MVDTTDATVAVTDYLKSLYRAALQPKIHVVHDGIEQPNAFKTDWRTDRGSRGRPLRAVLVTSSEMDQLPVLGTPPQWLEVVVVGRYQRREHSYKRLNEVRWKLAEKSGWHERLDYLRFLADGRIRRVPWDPLSVYEELRRADIGIIPIDSRPEAGSGLDSPGWMLKSENRLTMKMCIGLPVVATPIPSYRQVIEQGRNGFLASSRAEWIENLDALREPTMRRSIGQRARESVLERYSMHEQAERLIGVLRQLLADSH
jgi:glycosyltransferase involved in cell wall biosynthesis